MLISVNSVPTFCARLVFLVFFAFAVQAQQVLQNVPAELVQYPELILYNGKIATMNDASLGNSPGRFVEALAIVQDRIKSVGTTEDVFRLAGPQTRKIDLNGRTVLPGMINTHTHIHDHALWLWVSRHPEEADSVMRRIAVDGATFADLTKGIELAIKENIDRFQPGQWAWIDLPAEGTPTSGEGPTGGLGTQYILKNVMSRERLDELSPDVPVLLMGAPRWQLNSKAREVFFGMYGVAPTDEAEEGIGENTTFRRSLLTDSYFRNHMDELANIIEDAMKHQAALGFTTFASHIEPQRVHDAYQILVRGDRMPMRLAWSDSSCEQAQPEKANCMFHKSDLVGLGTEYFWNIGITLRGVDSHAPEICSTMELPKGIIDRERCKLEPGSEHEKAARAALLSRQRFIPQHSTGDRGMDYFMDLVEELIADKNTPSITLGYIRSLRISSDHCTFYPRQEQIPRMVHLGMIVSCGGREIDRASPWLNVYGEENANRVSPIRSMLDGGLMPVAEGEFAVESGKGETAFAQYMPLITRKDSHGKSIAPEEAIDRVTLIKMATVWASRFVLKEQDLGTIEPGKLADLIVLNKDYFSIPEAELPSVYPLMTMLGGKPIVIRQEYSAEIGLPATGPQMEFR